MKEIYVDSLSVPPSSSSDAGSNTIQSSCQLRYCHSLPILLCTPCRSGASTSSQRKKSLSRKSPSLTMASVSQAHIVHTEPPCWLVIPDWNLSFLHYSSLLKGMHDQGLTVWSFDPRGQGLSESPSSSQCASIDSFDTYASDLNFFLAFMRSSLPPSTRINVLAMGVMAEVLYAKRHLWRGTDTDTDIITVPNIPIGGLISTVEICDGTRRSENEEKDERLDKFLLVQTISAAQRWQLTLSLYLPDVLCQPTFRRRSQGWLGCARTVHGSNRSGDGGPKGVALTIPVSRGIASLLLAVHRSILWGRHTFLRLLKGLSPCCLRATRLALKLVKVFLPTRFRDGRGVTSSLQAMQQWLLASTLPSFSRWLHDTPSVVVMLGCSTCGSGDGEEELHQRYPFLQPQRGSVAWYTHWIQLGKQRTRRPISDATGAEQDCCV